METGQITKVITEIYEGKKIVAAGNRTRYLARARRVQWELNCERAEEGENS